MALLLALSACAGGGGGDDPAAAGQQTVAAGEVAADESTSTSLRPCSEDTHLVAFDWAGFLTASQDDWADWIQGHGEPEARPGGPEVVQAYRDRGYDVLYITTVPPNVLIEGVPVPTAVEGWLERHGFPRDEHARVFGFAGGQNQANAPILSITDELLRLSGEGVQLDAGYSENADKIYAFASGGIPSSRLYMIGEEAGVSGTVAIPDDDLQAHLATVEELPPVCAPE